MKYSDSVSKLADAVVNLISPETLPLFLFAAVLAWTIYLLARGRAGRK